MRNLHLLLAVSASMGCFSHMIVTKDDPDAIAKILEKVTDEISATGALITKTRDDLNTKYNELVTRFGGTEAASEEAKKEAARVTGEYAELAKNFSDLTGTFDALKKELDAPIHRNDKDLKDADREAAIALQKQIFLSKGGSEEEFVEDTDKLVDAKTYRSVAKKMMQGGLLTKAEITKSFNDAERKAFEASGMDSAFFSPQMLGLEVDCNIECASMVDLYNQVSVTRSTFNYPKVIDYGAIGSYDCDATCDAELGPEGNITYGNGKTYDFRGAFCFQKKVLQEANYDLLAFMFRSAQRSYRINRNRALITGDGKNEPMGWLRSGSFTALKTAGLKFNHQDFRRFVASAPVEYGPVVATMHQNMFAYLASSLDNEGRFIFGDGMMTFSPDDVTERIRISNCLPDATDDGAAGNVASPFTAGDFLVAAGNWNMAYSAVNKAPLTMEQYIGGSTKWCVKYQFSAEDGGFVMCPSAARTLVVGA